MKVTIPVTVEITTTKGESLDDTARGTKTESSLLTIALVVVTNAVRDVLPHTWRDPVLFPVRVSVAEIGKPQRAA